MPPVGHRSAAAYAVLPFLPRLSQILAETTFARIQSGRANLPHCLEKSRSEKRTLSLSSVQGRWNHSA